MRKSVTLMIVILFSIIIALPCCCSLAESSDYSEIDSGKIKYNVASSFSSFPPSMIYNNAGARNLATAAIILDITDQFNKNSPLEASKTLLALTEGCWIGISSDKNDLVVISYYDEKKALLVATYSRKDDLLYTIFSIPEKMTNGTYGNIVAPLFEKEGITDYSEVKSEDVIAGIKTCGINVSISK